jgi:hypothetical protein
VEKVEVLDLGGRILESAAGLEHRKGRWESQRRFSRGSYFVRVQGGSKSMALKIVVP